MSSASPRYLREIVVVMLVVSAFGSAQMQMRLSSACTPLGPNTGEFSGVSPSCDSTSAERSALQSAGRAAEVAEGLGDGEVFCGVGVLEPEVEPLVAPPPEGELSGAVGEQAVSAAARLRAASTTATLRVSMAQG